MLQGETAEDIRLCLPIALVRILVTISGCSGRRAVILTLQLRGMTVFAAGAALFLIVVVAASHTLVALLLLESGLRDADRG